VTDHEAELQELPALEPIVIASDEAEFLAEPAITVETVQVPIVLAGGTEDEHEALAMPLEEPFEPPISAGPRTGPIPTVLPRRSATAWARNLGAWLPVATGTLIAVLGLIGGLLIALAGRL
jgi:hypothetical protein